MAKKKLQEMSVDDLRKNKKTLKSLVWTLVVIYALILLAGIVFLILKGFNTSIIASFVIVATGAPLISIFTAQIKSIEKELANRMEKDVS